MNEELKQELEAMKELQSGDSFTADHVHTLVDGIMDGNDYEIDSTTGRPLLGENDRGVKCTDKNTGETLVWDGYWWRKEDGYIHIDLDLRNLDAYYTKSVDGYPFFNGLNEGSNIQIAQTIDSTDYVINRNNQRLNLNQVTLRVKILPEKYIAEYHEDPFYIFTSEISLMLDDGENFYGPIHDDQYQSFTLPENGNLILFLDGENVWDTFLSVPSSIKRGISKDSMTINPSPFKPGYLYELPVTISLKTQLSTNISNWPGHGPDAMYFPDNLLYVEDLTGSNRYYFSSSVGNDSIITTIGSQVIIGIDEAAIPEGIEFDSWSYYTDTKTTSEHRFIYTFGVGDDHSNPNPVFLFSSGIEARFTQT